jgi:hypothetical protein
LWRARITPRADPGPSPAFPVSRFLERKGSWQRSSLTCRAAERHSGGFTVLCSASADSFTSYLTSSSRTRSAKKCRLISSPSRRCLMSMRRSPRTISRMYVAGEFRIFGPIFLEDGCSLFECHIDLSELGKILFCEVLNFVGRRLRCRRLLLNKGGLRRFLQKAEALGFVGAATKCEGEQLNLVPDATRRCDKTGQASFILLCIRQGRRDDGRNHQESDES